MFRIEKHFFHMECGGNSGELCLDVRRTEMAVQGMPQKMLCA